MAKKIKQRQAASRGESSSSSTKPNIFLFHTSVNSFQYLRQDAEMFEANAQDIREGKSSIKDQFAEVRFCRTALLLYILSLEALINRSIDHFMVDPARSFLIEKESSFNFADKWRMLPMFVTAKEFDTKGSLWAKFKELIAIRNDFVHPKHDRKAYYRAKHVHELEPLDWRRIPKDSGLKESDIVYPQTKIPRDPYAIKLEHVRIARSTSDLLIKELDALMNFVVCQDGKHLKDSMTLFYPPGSTLDSMTSAIP